jgi:flavorubredoxin
MTHHSRRAAGRGGQGVANIVVLYSTLSGNTREAAEHVAAGARLVPGAEVELMDAARLDLAVLESARGVAIGSPNYYSYPSGLIKHFFDLVLHRAAFRGKPYVTFSTHGGGGGVSSILENLAKGPGMKQVAPGVDVAGAPKGDDPKALRKLGQILATQSIG